MRILIAHNRYQVMAGEDGVVAAEMALLKAYGHSVELLEADNQSIQGAIAKAKAAMGVVYSFESRRRLREKIRAFHPDVVHVHNFFPLLSPALYDACSESHVPVIQTLHNYRITCPSANLFRDGKICESCVGKTLPLAGVMHRCYRESLPESVAVAAMIAAHHLRRTWQDKVDAYITLTPFQQRKMVEIGLPGDRVFVKPNFLFDPLPLDVKRSEPYALYVGRLWAEKGIDVLIDAYVNQDVKIPLKIVGDGVLQADLVRRVENAGLIDFIDFLGWKSKPDVLALMGNARFLVFPSVWYETFGLTMIEAFACSVPVIASRLGGMAEIVEDGVTGLLFEAGNGADLAAKMNWAIAHPQRMVEMGRAGRSAYEARYTPEQNYGELMGIYERVVNRFTLAP
jgi:glycosyltransferase involved in cell wall biosynthesis